MYFDHMLMMFWCFWMVILMMCSICDYVWGVDAARSSPIVVFRTILVDFGELLGSYFGAMVSLGESFSAIFGVIIGGVFQTLFWG